MDVENASSALFKPMDRATIIGTDYQLEGRR
jgi:hypothetical protein